MSELTTGELAARLEALTEQVQDAQKLWLIVSRRQDDVAALASATDRLSESTEGVDSTLRTVGQAMAAAREAKTIAQNVQAQQMPRDEIYERLERGRKINRRIALTALLLAVAAVVAGVVVAAHITNQNNRTRYRLCTERATYDNRQRSVLGADITYRRRQLQLDHTNQETTAALIASFPKQQRMALRVEHRKSVNALKTVLAKEERAYAAGIVGQCSSLPR